MPQPKSFFLAGEWINSEKKLAVTYPYNNQVVDEVYLATPKHIEDAIQKAVAAFSEMKNLPSYKRYEILMAVARSVEEAKEDFAKTITLECGKSITDSRTEVSRCINTLILSAEEAKRMYGEIIPADLASGNEKRWVLVRRFPIGPIAGITPFNFPLNLVAHKVGPALAAGCPIIIKPASKTPLSALKLAELFSKTDLPKGALSVLPVESTVAEPLITDPRLKVLSFTGGTIGWKLKKQAGDKKVVLELGGNAGVIIEPDSDLAFAAKRVTQGGFALAGQSCIAVQRIYVHNSIAKPFYELLQKEINALKEGDPLNPETTITPMIDEKAAERTEEWLKEAVQLGAEVMIGGKRRGAVFLPTVIRKAPPRAKVCSEEIFAPLKTVFEYDDFEQAVREINDSWYGLQAGVFTQDIRKIWYAFEHIETGGVIMNDIPTYRAEPMPYGGVKGSGVGREGPRYAIEDFTERKALILKMS